MATGSATLSVVMPTRNQATFIEAAARSALEQPEVQELVVADGASTDGTPAILQALCDLHPGRVSWVSEPDTGPADAVNKAVDRARGDVIGWLNSDDLYTPGAAARALRAFEARPDLVLVYGEGEHVDEHGASLGRYPTLGPDAPLAAWADGCPVCQPTAFFRRDAFVELGGLDRTLRTAFDFEFWLRMWKAYPGRIARLLDLQAQSRLHEGGITLRMREQVAMEGLRVVHRHLGSAPDHWLVTHVGEALAACPFEAEVDQVRAHLLTLADQAAPWLGPGGAERLKHRMKTHRAWQLARPDLVADVHPDGWAPPALKIRLRQRGKPYRHLRLWGRHAAPQGGRLELKLDGLGETGAVWCGGTSAPGPFSVVVPLPAAPGARLDLVLTSHPAFVPAQALAGSKDTRQISFILDAMEVS